MVKSANTKLDYLDMLLFPLRGTSLFALLGLALLFMLAHAASILGLWLYLLCSFALLQYGFNTSVSSSMGHYEPPPISADDFSLSNNLPPVQLLFFFGLIAALINLLSERFDPGAGMIVLIVFVGLLPAIVGTLAVTRSIIHAVNPVVIGRMISAVGKHYWYLVIWLIGSIFIIKVIQQSIHSYFVTSALSIYSFLLLFHASGRLMFTHRDELGLATLSPAERIEREDQRFAEQLIERKLEELHQIARAQPKLAAEELVQYCLQEKLSIEQMEQLFARTQSWTESTTALWFARALITRLYADQRLEAALKVTSWCLQKESEFRPEQADTIWGLSQFSLSQGQIKLAVVLLHDFAKRFPHHANATPALFSVGRIALERQNNRKLANLMYAQLIERGIDSNDPRMKALKEDVNPSS